MKKVVNLMNSNLNKTYLTLYIKGNIKAAEKKVNRHATKGSLNQEI